MPYIVIGLDKREVIYKITDFIRDSAVQIIDLSTKEGKEQREDLLFQGSKKKRRQESLQEPKLRQTSLDEFDDFKFLAPLLSINNTLEQDSPLFNQDLKEQNEPKSLPKLRLRQTSLGEFEDFNFPEKPMNRETSPKRGRPLHPKRPEIVRHVKRIKAKHETFGRTRIERELPDSLDCSEATISRILREEGLQNAPKRLASEVQINIWAPFLENYAGESFSLGCEPKNGLILIVILFQMLLESLIRPSLTEEEIKHVLAYSMGMLFEKPVYRCLEAIPPQLAEVLGFDGEIKLKEITTALKTLGRNKESVAAKKIASSEPHELAMDEKVIERYSKQPHIDMHDEDCQTGYFYCSRRNKSVLAESVEVIADITQEGIALPLYFMFTPHSLTKREQAELAERGLAQRLEDVPDSINLRNISTRSKPAKGKRAKVVFLLLDVISNLMGHMPLRFDNNYAQKETIRRLQDEKWAFMGHGKSNLTIGRSLKKRMKKENLKYAYEFIDSADYGGQLLVVGYQKNGRIHIYLTNETDYESAKAIIEEYRDRWRLENTFKWTAPLTLLSGSDPMVHLGQYIVAFYFLSYLVHYFRAATPTIASLLERPASVHYENDVLTITFSLLRKFYWEKLVNLRLKLPESQFSWIKISYDET